MPASYANWLAPLGLNILSPMNGVSAEGTPFANILNQCNMKSPMSSNYPSSEETTYQSAIEHLLSILDNGSEYIRVESDPADAVLSGPAFDARLDEGLESMDDASRPASLLDGFWGISPEYDGSIFGGSEEYTFEQQIEEATNYLSHTSNNADSATETCSRRYQTPPRHHLSLSPPATPSTDNTSAQSSPASSLPETPPSWSPPRDKRPAESAEEDSRPTKRRRLSEERDIAPPLGYETNQSAMLFISDDALGHHSQEYSLFTPYPITRPDSAPLPIAARPRDTPLSADIASPTLSNSVAEGNQKRRTISPGPTPSSSSSYQVEAVTIPNLPDSTAHPVPQQQDFWAPSSPSGFWSIVTSDSEIQAEGHHTHQQLYYSKDPLIEVGYVRSRIECPSPGCNESIVMLDRDSVEKALGDHYFDKHIAKTSGGWAWKCPIQHFEEYKYAEEESLNATLHPSKRKLVKVTHEGSCHSNGGNKRGTLQYDPVKCSEFKRTLGRHLLKCHVPVAHHFCMRKGCTKFETRKDVLVKTHRTFDGEVCRQSVSRKVPTVSPLCM